MHIYDYILKMCVSLCENFMSLKFKIIWLGLRAKKNVYKGDPLEKKNDLAEDQDKNEIVY